MWRIPNAKWALKRFQLGVNITVRKCKAVIWCKIPRQKIEKVRAKNCIKNEIRILLKTDKPVEPNKNIKQKRTFLSHVLIHKQILFLSIFMSLFSLSLSLSVRSTFSFFLSLSLSPMNYKLYDLSKNLINNSLKLPIRTYVVQCIKRNTFTLHQYFSHYLKRTLNHSL